MTQRDLFPLSAISVAPSGLGTADCELLAIGADGFKYLLKQCSKHPYLPATEWICAHLAEAVGIPMPACKIVELPDESFAFGSRWEGGIRPIGDLLNISNPTLLSSIYAFDIFIQNDDRHRGNYLLREQHGAVVVMAIDHSRALLYHGWPLPVPPLNSNCNTRAEYRIMRMAYPFDESAAENTLEMIVKRMSSAVRGAVLSMPESWLDSAMAHNLLDWCGSDACRMRADNIMEGLRNGAYL